MTEAEWLASLDSHEMLVFASDKLSDRKLRLFAVACCRLIWQWIPEESSRDAVLVGERFADRLATKKALQKLRIPMREALRTVRDSYTRHCARHACVFAVENIAERAALGAAVSAQGAVTGREKAVAGHTPTALAICQALRDIAGLLQFRPVALNPAWLTSDVLTLARGIYEERAFDRMPILADALQDAGCENDDILEHCRGNSPHVRGCWVVDQVLGKS